MVRLEHSGISNNYQNKICFENKNDTRDIIKTMMKIVSLLSVVTVVFMSFIQEAIFTSNDEKIVDLKNDKFPNDEVKFSHHAVLDKHGKYHLYWLPEEKHITFEVQVSTLGYVGLGFSTNGRMKGSDIVIGWIKEDSTPFLDDRHSTGHKVPLIDASQDYKLLSGYQNDTHTVLRFSRLWDTCDMDDMILGDDTVRVIWAYHPNKPKNNHHIPHHGHKRKGVRSLHLKEMPQTKIEPDLFTKTWDLNGRNVRLPNDDHTHYYCQIFKAPPLESKHHMIGFEPIIQEGHEAYVHHMVLYECHVKGGDDSSDDWFSHHVDAEGEACYSPNMPQEWSFCLATNAWAWAIGSSGETLPDHVGMPIGEEFGGATYFMLETHYDNPTFEQDLVDTSGIRILYTNKLRQHDTGMILIGTEVNFLHIIPPLQKSFLSLGRCTSECTSNGLKSEGIHLLSGVLHSHLAARKMRIRQFRSGKELPIVMEDNNYDFNFQSSRQPRSESGGHVLPGDELFVECDYDTSQRQQPTFGGLSTKEEMCLGFMLYYPRQELADCRSLPSLSTFMSLLGIESLHGNSFEKLSTFLKDLGGTNSDGSSSLMDLIQSLTAETGQKLSDFKFHNLKGDETGDQLLSSDKGLSATSSFEDNLHLERLPLSEEDILKKPFYTVEEPSFKKGTEDMPQGSNYRNLLIDMLLNIRIKSPSKYANMTLGQRFSSINWKDSKVHQLAQDRLYFGKHNNVCLAHGRVPIIPYEEHPFPHFNDEEMSFQNSTTTKTQQTCKESNFNDSHGEKNFYTTKQLKLHAAAIELISHTNSNSSTSLKNCDITYVLIILFSFTVRIKFNVSIE